MSTLRLRSWFAMVVMPACVTCCGGNAAESGSSTPDGAAGSAGTATGNDPTSGGAESTGGFGTGTGGATGGTAGGTGGLSFVFVDANEITHDRDYFPLQYGEPSYLPADVPTNWLSPVDYSQGTLKMTLDVLDVPEGTSAEFYYTVTFTQTGADYDEGWLRPAIHVVPGQTHYEESWPLGETQFVWNDGVEHTSTAAESWDFSRPFDKVAGDLVAWPNASFPIRVKVRLELSLP